MDKELESLVNKEISPELLKELNITTMEQYNELIHDDKNKNEKNKNKNNKNKKEEKISKTKLKEQMRKQQSILNKKIKNEQRAKILQSLEKHNNQNERKLVDSLDSSKNLGKKRKKSKDFKDISFDNQPEGNEDQSDISDASSFSVSEHNNYQNDSLPNKINLCLNEKGNINNESYKNEKDNLNCKVQYKIKKNLMDFSIDEKFKILGEVKAYRVKESFAELQKNSYNSGNNLNISDDTKEDLLINLESLTATTNISLEDLNIDQNLLNFNENSYLEIPSKDHINIVSRNQNLQAERLQLPIVKYEQEIMDKINHNLFTVICGETGSGKSTQIPQFLYEYGYTNAFGAIAVTQPRRVAAISLATRVANELNCKLGEEVGYQIRYDSKHFSENTKIKFLTDGILLKEIESDSFLFKYSIIIIDEAHERTINTDILIGLLSQAAKYRLILSKNKIKVGDKFIKPLRVVIMSATMRVDEFLDSEIFSPKPAFMKVEARRFPVTVHHLKRTEKDHVEQAFKMTCKIHRKLPPGGILIFLTGKQEILTLCEKLKKEILENQEKIEVFKNKSEHLEGDQEENNKISTSVDNQVTTLQTEDQTISLKIHDFNTNLIPNTYDKKILNEGTIEINEKDKFTSMEHTENNENNEISSHIKEEDLIVNSHDLDEEEYFNKNFNKEKNSEDEEEEYYTDENQEKNKMRYTYKPAIILPLFSSLSKEQQMSIFQKIDPLTRLIVVSTNIAETSLTIPNVRYVVDSGKAKKRIEWISQASAEQRTGRAGRTCPGYCYRLYSNGLFCKMDKFTEPQIVSSPLDQTILYLKSLNIKDINKFPFLTKPEREFVDKAVRHLLLIGALDSTTKNIIKSKVAENELNKLGKSINDEIKYDDDTNITEVGRLMLKFPLVPRLAKILILANKLNMLSYGLIISAILSIEDLFEVDFSSEQNFKRFNPDRDNNEELDDAEAHNSKSKRKRPKNLKDVLEERLICPFSDAVSLMNLITYFFISFDKNRVNKKNTQNNFARVNDFFQYKTNKEINYLINLFCENHYLNNKKFKEMLDLLEQLTRITKLIFKKENAIIDFKLLKLPSKNEQLLLCQILLSGYLDNISRKKIIYDKLSNEEEVTTQKRLIYESNENNEEVNIHPFSVIFKSNLKSANVGSNLASPEYIIFKEILQENKTFMNINTIIKPEWLFDMGGDLVNYNLNNANNLCEPYYDKNSDTLFCYVNMKYGYKSWEIPNVLVEMNKSDDNFFRYFAKLLLEGKIFESLKNFQKCYVQKPSILTKQVSILPCVTILLNDLRMNKIFTKQDILNKWKQNNKFLLETIMKWINDDKAKRELMKIWPLRN